MKLKIVDPKENETSTGKKNVLFRDENNNPYDSWDLGLLDKAGQIVEGTIKPRTYQGREYLTFTPEEETEKEEVSSGNGQVPAEVWEKKDEWQRAMNAWKGASTLYEGTGNWFGAVAVAAFVKNWLDSGMKDLNKEKWEELVELMKIAEKKDSEAFQEYIKDKF